MTANPLIIGSKEVDIDEYHNFVMRACMALEQKYADKADKVIPINFKKTIPINFKIDKDSGNIVAPLDSSLDLLSQQGEFLYNYIANSKSRPDVNPELLKKSLFDAAYKTVDKHGNNALFWAIEKGDRETASELIKLATPEQLFHKNNSGSTALHYAIKHDDMESAAEIIKKGRSEQIFAQTNTEFTSLHMAVFNNNEKAFGLLIGKEDVTNGQIFQKDKDSSTALHYAIINENKKIALALIEKATPEQLVAENRHKLNPLQMAIEKNMDDVIKAIAKKANYKDIKAYESNETVSGILKERRGKLSLVSDSSTLFPGATQTSSPEINRPLSVVKKF